ncbi:hypothetical protein GOP47_0028075 [Adiantum capillus-veneris]|nr:hypothetical protein GOP47_0028075 [Adiantum capillus-veneris]
MTAAVVEQLLLGTCHFLHPYEASSVRKYPLQLHALDTPSLVQLRQGPVVETLVGALCKRERGYARRTCISGPDDLPQALPNAAERGEYIMIFAKQSKQTKN